MKSPLSVINAISSNTKLSASSKSVALSLSNVCPVVRLSYNLIQPYTLNLCIVKFLALFTVNSVTAT